MKDVPVGVSEQHEVRVGVRHVGVELGYSSAEALKLVLRSVLLEEKCTRVAALVGQKQQGSLAHITAFVFDH